MENFGNLKIVFGPEEEKHPRCPHGPTLLFERQMGGGPVKQFYACSAYRNRKDCSFYHDKEEKITQAKLFRWSQQAKALTEGTDHNTRYQLVKQQKQSGKVEVSGLEFCHDCGRVVEEMGECSKKQHNLISLTEKELARPCSMLQAKSKDKKEAQYFFSQETISLIGETICSQRFTNVLCLGCPSIFESLPTEVRSKSLLMDIDQRFLDFYSQDEFLWYNLFNGHFFSGVKAATTFQDFLIGCEKLLIIWDPPFGVKTELIANSLRRVTDQLSNLSITATAHTLWVFPYYMEKQVVDHSAGLAMSDYKVTYTNHQQFGVEGGKGTRKLGSPVRIYTDIPLSKFPLPANQGYRRCQSCDLWVAEENKHCGKCGKCPSKDGRTYIHCDDCNRCVKPTYEHCKDCQRCKLADHKCGDGGTVSIAVKKKQGKDVETWAVKRKGRKRNRNKRQKIAKKE